MRRERYTCSNLDGSRPLRVLATDVLHAAEEYWEKLYSDCTLKEKRDWESTIGDVLVTSRAGVQRIVTIETNLVLDFHALRERPVR